jgi:hypothetical protein
MKFNFKKVMAMLLIATVITSSVLVIDSKPADAATIYITVETFAKALTNELGLTPIAGEQKSQYVNALINTGIIREGDFSSYTKYLTRTDAAVLLNRADEYLYGDKLNSDLVNMALEKRISDIKQISESKRADVIKAYLKGYVKGYSNGTYCENRKFKGGSKITKSGALAWLKLLKDKSARAKVSPDGQLIRTTKLPKNYKMFPYILESYPNSYYEWQFKFQTAKLIGSDNKEIELKSLVNYASPADIDKLTTERYPDFPEMKKQNLNTWVEKTKKHLDLVFNVDYRTINDNWKEELLKYDYAYGCPLEGASKRNIDNYVKGMKENKTIVESSKISVDGSSLYYFNGGLYLRAYVRYRIVSSNVLGNIDVDTLIDKCPYEKILYSTSFVDIRGFELGKWVNGYYNINIGKSYGNTGDLGVVTGLFYETKGLD